MGQWGCLSAVVLGGVGLVLFVLGFEAHTTEAMPFGAVLLGVGLFIGVPSLRALRSAAMPGVRPVGMLLRLAMLVFSVGLGLVGLGMQPRTTEALPFGVLALVVGLVLGVVSLMRGQPVEVRTEVGADGARELERGPPSSVRCENCGSPAPLRLGEPTHATCAHCGARFALPAALTATLKAADLWVRAQGEAERRISAILRALPEKHVAWRTRLLRSSSGLAAIAALAAVFGWTRRNQDDSWHTYVAFGLASGVVAIALGRFLAQLIPRIAQGIVGHWAALQVPGVEGLACRVCGAALPGVAAPVLRCEYCAADNLAGPAVQALVAQRAVATVSSLRTVSKNDQKADELAAFSTVAFPVVTLVAWFAVGAFAGGVGGRALSGVHLSPSSMDFAVVRVDQGGGPTVCIAAVIPRGGQVELKFSGELSAQVEPAELRLYAVEQNVHASWFVGHEVNRRGKIEDVYSLVRSPNRVEGSLGPDLNLYFPYDGLGGEVICLDDVQASGAALKL